MEPLSIYLYSLYLEKVSVLSKCLKVCQIKSLSTTVHEVKTHSVTKEKSKPLNLVYIYPLECWQFQ